jgi:PTS system nitrogen regulatory IIA component
MRPIDFNAVDGKPVDLIFAIISPPAKKGAEEPFSILAAISRALGDKGTASELRQARDARSVSKIFRRLDGPATSALS